MKLTRYEQDTIVNFNAEELDAIVYTHDKAIMRQLDALVTVSREGYLRLRGSRIERQ